MLDGAFIVIVLFIIFNFVLFIEISIKTGEWSEERTQKITKKHLKPVEEQAAKVDSLVEDIRKDMNRLIEYEEGVSTRNGSIRTRVFVFGVISIATMSLSTFLQIKYLKNFFRYKKII